MQRLIFTISIFFMFISFTAQAGTASRAYFSSKTLSDIEITYSPPNGCIDCPIEPVYFIGLTVKSKNKDYSFDIENNRCIAYNDKTNHKINLPFEKNFMENHVKHLKDYYVACSKAKAGEDEYGEIQSAKYINLYYFPENAKDYDVKVALLDSDSGLLLYRRDGSKHIFEQYQSNEF